ncbi:hypothetical protein F2P81_006026 [Scophthalmus maximus]|uniref:Uncharacterized protein n=1 Tax=Scophthalmus maximus TaxID=52904 RepID=A0A6A4TGY2_SCOMX|nr:hypothetical protein F2P81_006026 [Scophthalmus maximus]
MMATDAAEAGSRTTCPCPVPVPDTGLRAVSTGVARRRRDRQWRARLVYLQCYFLTIATILGTGILGLPVTIAHAGLLPFLVSFLVGFFVQALLIYLFVELLQKCQVVQLDSLKTDAAECIVMDQVIAEDPALTEDEDEDEGENAEADTGLLRPDAVALHNLEDGLQPNLHLLGHLFLSRPMSHAFNCVLLFQFISIGISYVLAGSEAYAALLNVSHIYVIPAFTWILTLAILLAHTVIQPVTSVLTLLKGILLIVTVNNDIMDYFICMDLCNYSPMMIHTNTCSNLKENSGIEEDVRNMCDQFSFDYLLYERKKSFSRCSPTDNLTDLYQYG